MLLSDNSGNGANILEFIQIGETEYQDFFDQCPYRNFMNSIEAMKLKRENNWQVELVGVKDQGRLVAAAALSSIPMMKVFRYYTVQRGFLMDYTRPEVFHFFMENLKKHLKRQKCLYLHTDPAIPYQQHDIDGNVVSNGFNNQPIIDMFKKEGFEHLGLTVGLSSYYQARWAFVLSLTGKTRADLLKNMHQQTRWSVNKTIRENIQVRDMTDADLPLFNDIMEHTGERRGFDNRGTDFYQKFLTAYGKHSRILLAYIDPAAYLANVNGELLEAETELTKTDAHLLETPNNKKFKKRRNVLLEAIETNQRKIKAMKELEAKHGSEIPLAASMFAVYDNEVTYLFSGAYDELKKYNGPYALQWTMLQYALDHKIPKYNFYGTSGDFRPEAADFGVYQFKKGFDGEVEELVGDFILPINKPFFALYKALGKLPQ